MKQEAKQVHAVQNHSVLVCSDACEHKQSQNIQRFLTFCSHRFFENPMNARHPLPRKMSTHTQHAHMHTCQHTHNTHTMDNTGLSPFSILVILLSLPFPGSKGGTETLELIVARIPVHGKRVEFGKGLWGPLG